MAQRAVGWRPASLWLLSLLRGSDLLGSAWPACCVGNHLLAAAGPGQQPHHLRAALLVQLPARRTGCSPRARLAQRRGAAREGSGSWAGRSRARLLLAPALWAWCVQHRFPCFIGIGWSAKHAKPLTPILSRIRAGQPLPNPGQASGRCGRHWADETLLELLGEGRCFAPFVAPRPTA